MSCLAGTCKIFMTFPMKDRFVQKCTFLFLNYVLCYYSGYIWSGCIYVCQIIVLLTNSRIQFVTFYHDLISGIDYRHCVNKTTLIINSIYNQLFVQGPYVLLKTLKIIHNRLTFVLKPSIADMVLVCEYFDQHVNLKSVYKTGII